MRELSERIFSDGFAELARHPEHPEAFTHSRKLPLAALIAALAVDAQSVAADHARSRLSGKLAARLTQRTRDPLRHALRQRQRLGCCQDVSALGRRRDPRHAERTERQ